MISRYPCLVLIMCFCVSVFCIVPAGAADPAPPSLPGTAAMNLTSAQQKKLSDLETASQGQAKQLFDQIRTLRGKLSDLYNSYSFDAGEARHLNHQLNHVQGQLLDLHLSEQQQLRGILTADQFAQLQAAIHQHGGWGDPARDNHGRPDGHGPGPGRGPGH